MDRHNHRVQVFDGTGKFLWKFGSQGSGNAGRVGSLLTPPETTKLWWWIKGITEFRSLTRKGPLFRTFGSEGNDDGRFVDPSGVAIDQEGNYVVSNDFCIQVFDSAGKFLRKFGSKGNGNGQCQVEFCQMEISWWGVTFKVNVKSSIHWATL